MSSKISNEIGKHDGPRCKLQCWVVEMICEPPKSLTWLLELAKRLIFYKGKRVIRFLYALEHASGPDNSYINIFGHAAGHFQIMAKKLCLGWV